MNGCKMIRVLLAALVAVAVQGAPILAASPGRGPVTDLPLPRYVSLKSSEGNARRGPGTSHRVDWVYRLRDMPLRVTAEFEHWRRVEDADGKGGWMHYALLSGVRTALVIDQGTAEHVSMHTRPDPSAPVAAFLEPGVVARLVECNPEWCLLRTGRIRGWVARDFIWGVDPDETLD